MQIGSWAVVDSLGDITDEEVREVVFPVLSHGALLHRYSELQVSVVFEACALSKLSVLQPTQDV